MIENQGGRALAIKADVSKVNEVQGMFDRAAREFGTVDLLVNNASITRHIELDDLDGASEEVWDELYAVNVKGMFYCARAAASLMKQNKQGAIVNVGSIAGRQ